MYSCQDFCQIPNSSKIEFDQNDFDQNDTLCKFYNQQVREKSSHLVIKSLVIKRKKLSQYSTIKYNIIYNIIFYSEFLTILKVP